MACILSPKGGEQGGEGVARGGGGAGGERGMAGKGKIKNMKENYFARKICPQLLGNLLVNKMTETTVASFCMHASDATQSFVQFSSCVHMHTPCHDCKIS